MYAGRQLSSDSVVGQLGLDFESCIHIVRHQHIPADAMTPRSARSVIEPAIASDRASGGAGGDGARLAMPPHLVRVNMKPVWSSAAPTPMLSTSPSSDRNVSGGAVRVVEWGGPAAVHAGAGGGSGASAGVSTAGSTGPESSVIATDGDSSRGAAAASALSSLSSAGWVPHVVADHSIIPFRQAGVPAEVMFDNGGTSIETQGKWITVMADTPGISSGVLEWELRVRGVAPRQCCRWPSP